ncbi:MAG: HEAT repeat domain-containing protein [Phototrophicales bacterium]|nr:HEAT repeat domain-containing protein [Phototrophicales bacterium]
MMDNYDDDFMDYDDDDLDELSELDLEDDYHLEIPLEELDADDDYSQLGDKPTLAEIETLLRLGDKLKPIQYPSLIAGLSDVSIDEAKTLRPAWKALDTFKRQEIMQRLVDAIEHNHLLNYRSWARMTIQDDDAQVRASGVELLWDDESIDTLHTLMNLIRNEKSIEVRVVAFEVLGRFILLGEYEKFDSNDIQIAQRLAYDTWNNPKESLEIRRRALEAFSNCTDDRLPAMIGEAYKSQFPEMQASAVFGMGRSYDNQWNNQVLKEIDNENPQIRYEAVRAAGELEIKKATQALGKLARDESDREIMLMAIWSLGEIGGDFPTKILQRLADKVEESEDDDLIEAIDEAIASASLADINI